MRHVFLPDLRRADYSGDFFFVKIYRLLRCCSGLVIICKLMCVYNRSPHGYAVHNINFTERKLLS